MNRILVTGAKGQLGISLKEIASEFPELKFHFASKEELDITSSETLEAFFSTHRLDVCINTAAYTNVEEAERNPEAAFEVNASGVRTLAMICRKYNVLLLHISTDYVFDGKNEKGYFPDDAPNPINVYGKSKLQGEVYIRHILDDYVILRTSWLYSEHGANFYKTIRRKLLEEGTIGVTDQQRGCPTHARDLARFILEWIIDPERQFGIMHYAGKEVMTWYEFARNIAREHAPDLIDKIVKDNNYRSFAARPANSVLLQT